MKKLAPALVSALILTTSLSFADNCYIGIGSHGQGKKHHLEMYSNDFKELKSELESKGYRVKYKGKTKKGNYVYYVYVDKDNKVDEIICLKCLGKTPPVTPDPDEELIPEPEPNPDPKPTPEPEQPLEPETEKPPVELG